MPSTKSTSIESSEVIFLILAFAIICHLRINFVDCFRTVLSLLAIPVLSAFGTYLFPFKFLSCTITKSITLVRSAILISILSVYLAIVRFPFSACATALILISAEMMNVSCSSPRQH